MFLFWSKNYCLFQHCKRFSDLNILPGLWVPFYVYLLTAWVMPNFSQGHICTHLIYGVTPPPRIDHNLSWDLQVKELSKKLSMANGIFSKLRHYVPKTTMLLVYYYYYYMSFKLKRFMYFFILI